MVLSGTVETLGKPAFRTDHQVEYLGTNWVRTVAFAGHNVQYAADLAVSEMAIELQAEFPERRDKLYALLEVEPTWRMHELSDGQRRYKRLCMLFWDASALFSCSSSSSSSFFFTGAFSCSWASFGLFRCWS